MLHRSSQCLSKAKIKAQKQEYSALNPHQQPVAGGANAQITPNIPDSFGFDKTSNVELGLKTLWADGKVLLNVALYQIDWEKYSASLYVRNVTDETAWLSMFYNFQQENRVTVNQPRSFGINFEVRF